MEPWQTDAKLKFALQMRLVEGPTELISLVPGMRRRSRYAAETGRVSQHSTKGVLGMTVNQTTVRNGLVVCLLSLSFISASSLVSADDWTQWSGSQRDGQWKENGILQEFPAGGLQPVWKVAIGSGYSGPVVADGRVFVSDYVPRAETKTLEAIERVHCLNEETGDILWTHQWETHYRRQMQSYATGPRATPLVKDGRVFVLGATGRFLALDADSGKVQWQHDSLEEFGAQVPIFGFASSPIAFKDSIICACGGPDGLLRAFDAASGKLLWKALPASHDLPYSAPEVMTLDGITQLVQWSQEALSGLNPETGELLWQVPFSAQSNMAIARPVQIGNRILVSGFYDGSMLVEVSDGQAKMLWKNGGTGEKPAQTESLHAVITTPLVIGDHFYGTCSYGELRGLSLKDGSRIWESGDYTRQGRWGSMFCVQHQDRWFVNNDLGELLIMRFSPQGPELLDRAQLIAPDTQCGYGPRRFADALVNWVHPAYANKHIIIRNDQEIRRVSLAAEQP